MRTAFIKTVHELAARNDNLFVVTADMGFSVFEKFREGFPGRFLNVGIAEANMIGISAGLAMSGKKVFAYSIVPFLTMRCFEQIRIDVCYQNINVKLVGSGGGLCYGPLGATHHSIEDIALMRALPNMAVICPGDPFESALATEACFNRKGPAYIRLGKSNEPPVHKEKPEFVLGKGIVMREGSDVALLTTGNMLKSAVEVADKLSENGVRTRLVSMHTIKPLDKELVLRCATETKAMFSLEEHSVIGGLGSAVAEVLAEEYERKPTFKRFGIPDCYAKQAGSQDYLRKLYGLSVDAITENILKEIKHM